MECGCRATCTLRALQESLDTAVDPGRICMCDLAQTGMSDFGPWATMTLEQRRKEGYYARNEQTVE